MSPEVRVVHLDPAPDVELLGTAVLVRGAAAVDLYRIVGEAISSSRTRDGIAAPPRLLQTLAALKAAKTAMAEQRRRADIADVRNPARQAQSADQEIRIKEVAEMCGISDRQARRLAPSLGGHKRGKSWVFDRLTVEAYLTAAAGVGGSDA